MMNKKKIFEIAVIVVSVIVLAALAFWGIKSAPKHEPERVADVVERASDDDIVQMALGQVYRYREGYAFTCQKYGVEMLEFPKKFEEKFKDEIAVIEQKVREMFIAQGGTEEQFNDLYAVFHADPAAQDMIFQSVTEDLDVFRRNFIVSIVAQNQGIEPQAVEYNEEMDKLLTLKDTCIAVDQNADLILGFDYAYDLIYRGAKILGVEK